MKTILITGLDGSGKSSILERLKKTANKQDVGFILLPHIPLNELDNHPELHKIAAFINTISCKADIEKIPALKALSLFSSMLLYRHLLEINKDKKIVYCERHPLIDTGIYATFYAAKLAPELVGRTIIEYLDSEFGREIEFLLQLLPDISPSKNSNSGELYNFIFEYFSVKNKTSIADMQSIFPIELPTKIYFLRANPELLFDRIKGRERMEAHETVPILKKLDEKYMQFFELLNKEIPGKVEIINANEIENLNKLYETINSKYLYY